MLGAPDPEYVSARRALLDALEALAEHRDSIIVVGAHAVYLRTGAAELAVAEFTTDADLAIDPASLRPDPRLDAALIDRGFVADLAQPGIYWSTDGIEVELMVPETMGGGGRRGARLGPHGNRSARKARGLEAALVDNATIVLEALDPDDRRIIEARVAGVAALVVAKAHKLGERINRRPIVSARRTRSMCSACCDPARPTPSPPPFSDCSRRSAQAKSRMKPSATSDSSSPVPDATGLELVGAAVEGLDDPSVVRASMGALVNGLLTAAT